MEFLLDDEAKSLGVKVPEKISTEAGKELSLKADNLTLEGKKNGVFKTAGGVKISLDDSSGALKMEASADISIKAGGKLTLQGRIVEIN